MGRRQEEEEEEWNPEDADGRMVFITSFFSALGAGGMTLGRQVDRESNAEWNGVSHDNGPVQ